MRFFFVCYYCREDLRCSGTSSRSYSGRWFGGRVGLVQRLGRFARRRIVRFSQRDPQTDVGRGQPPVDIQPLGGKGSLSFISLALNGRPRSCFITSVQRQCGSITTNAMWRHLTRLTSRRQWRRVDRAKCSQYWHYCVISSKNRFPIFKFKWRVPFIRTKNETPTRYCSLRGGRGNILKWMETFCFFLFDFILAFSVPLKEMTQCVDFLLFLLLLLLFFFCCCFVPPQCLRLSLESSSLADSLQHRIVARLAAVVWVVISVIIIF